MPVSCFFLWHLLLSCSPDGRLRPSPRKQGRPSLSPAPGPAASGAITLLCSGLYEGGGPLPLRNVSLPPLSPSPHPPGDSASTDTHSVLSHPLLPVPRWPLPCTHLPDSARPESLALCSFHPFLVCAQRLWSLISHVLPEPSTLVLHASLHEGHSRPRQPRGPGHTSVPWQSAS